MRHLGYRADIDRFGDWNEAICHLVMDVSASRPENAAPFRASISSVRLGAASLSRFHSGPHRIERDAKRIRRGRHDDYLVSFQRRGRTMVSCGDRRFILHPGDGAVLDCARPFTLSFPEAVERQIARIPRAVFHAGTGIERLDDALHLTGGTLMLRLLRHHFVEIGEEASPDLSSDLAYDLCRLLKGAVAGADGVPPANDGLWRRVRSLIGERLSDPDLTLDAAASALSLSGRTIQRAFARRGTTFRSYLLNRRLELTAEQLGDERFADCAITEVALRWGFNDTAHFSRVFRKRYRMSPTEFRSKPTP